MKDTNVRDEISMAAGMVAVRRLDRLRIDLLKVFTLRAAESTEVALKGKAPMPREIERIAEAIAARALVMILIPEKVPSKGALRDAADLVSREVTNG